MGALLLLSMFSFGQKTPSFNKKYDSFDKSTEYYGNVGTLGVFYKKQDGDNYSLPPQLSVTVYDTYLTYASGVIFLIEDGTTLEFSTDEQLGDYSSKHKAYDYTVYAYPSDEEWVTLSEKKIIGVKVHIFKRTYKSGSNFKLLVKKLIILKKVQNKEVESETTIKTN